MFNSVLKILLYFAQRVDVEACSTSHVWDPVRSTDAQELLVCAMGDC
jgi:hypothetical protein